MREQRGRFEMRHEAPNDVHRGQRQNPGRRGLRLRRTGGEDHSDPAALGDAGRSEKS